MLRKCVHILNTILTIPFGIGTSIMPRQMFEPFGFALDATGVLLAKGYAATALGYGLAFWFSRNIEGRGAQLGLIAASLAFNGLEALVQLPIAIQGLAKTPIWITAFSHAALTLLSLVALLRNK